MCVSLPLSLSLYIYIYIPWPRPPARSQTLPSLGKCRAYGWLKAKHTENNYKQLNIQYIYIYIYVYTYIYIYVYIQLINLIVYVVQKQLNTAKSWPPWKANHNPCLVTWASTRHLQKRCIHLLILWSADQGGIVIEVCLTVPNSFHKVLLRHWLPAADLCLEGVQVPLHLGKQHVCVCLPKLVSPIRESKNPEIPGFNSSRTLFSRRVSLLDKGKCPSMSLPFPLSLALSLPPSLSLSLSLSLSRSLALSLSRSLALSLSRSRSLSPSPSLLSPILPLILSHPISSYLPPSLPPSLPLSPPSTPSTTPSSRLHLIIVK